MTYKKDDRKATLRSLRNTGVLTQKQFEAYCSMLHFGCNLE